MALVATLAQRKRARVERLRAGVVRLGEELLEYARTNGGVFLLYGSAATGRMHFDSDVDIIVDFEPDFATAAIDFVEEACARLGVQADVQPKSWCKAGFLERIAPAAVVLR